MPNDHIEHNHPIWRKFQMDPIKETSQENIQESNSDTAEEIRMTAGVAQISDTLSRSAAATSAKMSNDLLSSGKAVSKLDASTPDTPVGAELMLRKHTDEEETHDETDKRSWTGSSEENCSCFCNCASTCSCCDCNKPTIANASSYEQGNSNFFCCNTAHEESFNGEATSGQTQKNSSVCEFTPSSKEPNSDNNETPIPPIICSPAYEATACNCCHSAQQTQSIPASEAIARNCCDSAQQTQSTHKCENFCHPMPYLWYPTENGVKQIEYVRRIESEFDYLQQAFLDMTTNYARMQFRLRQLIRAAPSEREALLVELERLALQEASHIDKKQELPRIQRDLHCMGDIRRKQSCIMQKLHDQLTELSVAAAKEGEMRICNCDREKKEKFRLKMTLTLTDPAAGLCGCYYPENSSLLNGNLEQ